MRRLQIHSNVDAPGGNYPYGRARNNPGDDSGTRADEELIGDVLQLMERLMAVTGIVANDLPENNADGFQLMTALQTLINTSVTSLLDLKGNIDASTNPNYPAGVVGDAYYITVAGRVGGGSGKVVEIGDLVVCKAINAGGTEASVGTSWFVLQANLVQATETVAGIAEIATQAETDGFADDLRIVTPLKLGVTLGGTKKIYLNITNWNLTLGTPKNVPHGLTFAQIKSWEVTIIDDAGTVGTHIGVNSVVDGDAFYDATNFTLAAGTVYNNANYAGTGLRGFIKVEYTP